jgi:serine/threonine-protein kinase
MLKDRHPNGMPLDEVTANILLTDGRGAQRRILLSDFGIARQMGDVSGLTATNHAIGTVAYSAPEQLMGAHVDGRADRYMRWRRPHFACSGSPIRWPSSASTSTRPHPG